MDFVKNPLIKIIAMVIILYFALFKDDHNHKSLGARFSKETLRKDIHQIQEKTQFISKTIRDANAMKSRGKHEKSTQNVECGNNVAITYQVFSKDDPENILIDIKKVPILVGTNANPLIEKNIIGMSNDELKDIEVPNNFELGQNETSNQIGNLALNYSDLIIRFRILSIHKVNLDNKNIKLNCS